MIRRFQSFVTGISVCYKYIQKIKSAEMTEFGLKGAHVMCLFFLHHNPDGLSPVQLTELCAEDKAAISRNIAFLQQKGYIAEGEKRYRAKIRLTDAGKAVAEKIDMLIGQWVTFGGDGLSEEDRSTFYTVLGVIAGNLQERLESPKRD